MKGVATQLVQPSRLHLLQGVYGPALRLHLPPDPPELRVQPPEVFAPQDPWPCTLGTYTLGPTHCNFQERWQNHPGFAFSLGVQREEEQLLLREEPADVPHPLPELGLLSSLGAHFRRSLRGGRASRSPNCKPSQTIIICATGDGLRQPRAHIHLLKQNKVPSETKRANNSETTVRTNKCLRAAVASEIAPRTNNAKDCKLDKRL